MRREVQKGRPSARRQASGDLLALPDGLGQGIRGPRRRGAHAQKQEQGMDPGGEARPRREGPRRELNARGREERPHIIRDALPMGEKVSRKGHGWARMPSWKTPEGADHAEEESQTDPLGEGGARDPQGEERIPRGGERIPKKLDALVAEREAARPKARKRRPSNR